MIKQWERCIGHDKRRKEMSRSESGGGKKAHLFIQHIMIICYVPDTVLDPRITAVNKRQQNHCQRVYITEGGPTKPKIINKIQSM